MKGGGGGDDASGGPPPPDGEAEGGEAGPVGTPGLTCELCGGPVLDRHCKILCLNCGYQRDCSDP